MAGKRKRSQRKTSSKRYKPSAESLQNDIRQIRKAIASTRKVTNLPGMRSVLTSLYGEKRYAEQLLVKHYPRSTPRSILGKRTGRVEQQHRKRTTKGEKIVRGWRQAKAIKKNYGNDPVIAKMTVPEIRGEYRKFKRGLKTRVPDIMWYNPSP